MRYSRRFARARVLTAVCATMLVVGACANAGAEKQDDASPGEMSKSEIYQRGIVGVDGDPGEPVEGGTLTMADYTEARSLNPTETYPHGAAGGTPLAAIYDVLMRFHPESGEFEPWLAESLTTEDNKTWTLKLRDGVTFNDGSPLDAQAVVSSIGYYMQNQGMNTLLLATNIADMRAADPTTVVFEMRQPWATFPNMLAGGPGMIMAPAAYSGKEFKPIGAGPFELEKYAPAEELILASRDDYWDGAPHLDRLRFVWLGSDEAKYDSLKAGDVDVAYARSAVVLEEARKAGSPGFLVVEGLGDMLWVNHRDGRPGADPRVRQAIQLTLDPEFSAERGMGGAGLPSRHMFSEQSPWFTGVDTPQQDLDEAKRLVEEAKSDGYDGELVYIGQSDAVSRSEALANKALLDQVGFTVKLDLLRTVADQTARLMVSHDYDLGVSAMSIPDADPYSRLYSGLHSQSPMNVPGYASPEMDDLLAQLQASGSPEETKVALVEIEKLWHEDVPGIPMGAAGTFLPWRDNVHGIAPTTDTLLLFGNAWVS